MKDKKFNFKYLIPVAFVALLFVPKAFAASYECLGTITTKAQLDACCYPASLEPYKGISCTPEGEYLQTIGTGDPICSSSTTLLARATAADAKLFKGFNCFTNAFNKTCKDPATQCYDSTQDKCIVYGGPDAACEAANRKTTCNSTCDGCKDGYVLCGGVCKLPAASSCIGTGYEVDQCTGQCACPVGETRSGLLPNTCITYLERFKEILSHGLAIYGGPSGSYDGIYDYSATGTGGNLMTSVYLKSDVAESLNWNSSTLPQAIKNLLTNAYNLCTSSADCTSPKVCTEGGGYCYTPGKTSGACTSSSDCEIGYSCNAAGQCVLIDTGAGKSYFVGLTGNYNGSQTGYKNANARCSAAFANSHICNADEMIDSYVYSKTTLSGKTGWAWINNGPPGYIKFTTNDCAGWSSSASTIFGSDWNFTKSAPYVASCDQTIPFACCK